MNVSGTGVNHDVCVGALAGESTGLVTHCSVQAELMFKVDTRLTGYGGDTRNANLFVGGAVGKDSGTIACVQTDVFVDANEYVYATAQLWENYLNTYLHIGGIVGGTYGTVTDCSADLDCQLYTNAGGNAETRRYTRVGGIAGCCYELSSVTGCYSEGTISFQRLGRYASSFEMAVGGIVGKLESGMVNNCASGLDITVVESAGTTTGGIVGWLNVNGKVSNVAYYGTIHVEASSEGWFGGLAGRVSGWLTKGYFQGQIQSGGNRYADIVGRIDASGSVSKTVGYGNTSLIYGENNGSSIYNYVIGVDYGVEILYSREMLFDTLGLYEADFWGIDEERGLYLITFLGR